MVGVTLNQGVEEAIREAFPEIREIIDTTDHAAGTNPYYRSSEG
jgi:Fe-S cluster biogenesis protein NfuA